MRIEELIEEIVLDQLQLQDQNKNLIIDNYTTHQWVKAIERFLKGIGSHHAVRGNIVFELHSFLDQYRETHHLTRDQKWFVLHTLIENWNQISCQARAELIL